MRELTDEFRNDLDTESALIEQAVRELDSVRNMIAGNWDGDSALSYLEKLDRITAEISHTGEAVEHISENLSSKS